MLLELASIEDEGEFECVLAQLPVPVKRRLLEMWCWRAHGGQMEPAAADAGGPWRVWLVMAGRGFGKTKAGAEWVCDELAKWARAEACWDNLQMTLRLGERPRIMVTTRPRAVPVVRRVLALPDLAKTDGTSWENVHLPKAQLDAVTALYGGTRLGRQELGGELIEDAERALFTRAVLERARERAPVPVEWMKRGRVSRPRGRACGADRGRG